MISYRYEIATGKMYEIVDDSVEFVAAGYSGKGRFINDPTATARPSEGPIPIGIWTIGRAFTHSRLGAEAIPLTPVIPGYRTGFYIHGDNARGNRSASTGCIILPIWARKRIATQRGAKLEVTA